MISYNRPFQNRITMSYRLDSPVVTRMWMPPLLRVRKFNAGPVKVTHSLFTCPRASFSLANQSFLKAVSILFWLAG